MPKVKLEVLAEELGVPNLRFGGVSEKYSPHNIGEITEILSRHGLRVEGNYANRDDITILPDSLYINYPSGIVQASIKTQYSPLVPPLIAKLNCYKDSDSRTFHPI